MTPFYAEAVSLASTVPGSTRLLLSSSGGKLELIISTLTEDSIKVLYRITETELVIQSRTTWKTYASRRHGSPTSADDSTTVLCRI